MSDEPVKITVIGNSGTGKTCYLLGMYYDMCAGHAGFSICASDDDQDRELTRKYENMQDASKGADRFPRGTDQSERYDFKLQYALKTIKPFSWIDYPGGYLKLKNDSAPGEYEKVKQSIDEATCLFICIDGENLCGNNYQKKLENIKNQRGGITPFFSKFRDENREIPPVVMLITKYDLCKDDTDKEEICKLLKKAFSVFFVEGEKNIVAIIPVSLGSGIMEDEGTGLLQPLNMALPIFMGIWCSLLTDVSREREEVNGLHRKIDDNKQKIKKENDRWFFMKDEKKIASLENANDQYRITIETLNNEISVAERYNDILL